MHTHTYSATSPKDKLAEVQEAFTAEQQQQQQENQSTHHSGGSPTSDHGSVGGCSSAGVETMSAQPEYNSHTVFRSQEKYELYTVTVYACTTCRLDIPVILSIIFC